MDNNYEKKMVMDKHSSARFGSTSMFHVNIGILIYERWTLFVCRKHWRDLFGHVIAHWTFSNKNCFSVFITKHAKPISMLVFIRAMEFETVFGIGRKWQVFERFKQKVIYIVLGPIWMRSIRLCHKKKTWKMCEVSVLARAQLPPNRLRDGATIMFHL